MASSSSSSSPPNANHTNTYDVFLSFRGEDTRHNFTDHIYHALVRSGLRTFRDNDSIGRGQLLKPEIETAIKQSRASVIVLSQNYADSRWCLDELVLILEQRLKFNHFALPVFHGVDPSDVRNHRGAFNIDESKWKEADVIRWKAALTEVADLTGMVVSGFETEFITNIVHTVDSQLDLKLLSTPAYLTGIDSRVKVINTWLKNEQSNSNVLAICGMGGIGKTTLSQYMYNSNKQIFESSSFLEEIGKHCQQPLGLLGLQKQLLGDIFGGSYEKISIVSECTRKIEKALQMKRVLIVLDDIDDIDQLAALLGTKAFHTQSKIIITTRLLNVDAWFGPISRGCQVYELDLLNHYESVELLSCHAFGSKVPMEGFTELAVALAKYCGGNPLALKVLGSSLCVRAEDEQNKSDNMIEIWKSTLSSLNSLKGDIDFKIQCVLRRSFDSLPRDIHRELFLHISFYFVGDYADDVVTILEHDWHAKAGIMTLINRCLLTVSPSNKVMMHQLLQEMGRQIVREESKDPTKRSRVVEQDDESYHVLAKGSGSKTLEGLALNVHNLKQGIRSKQLVLKTDSLAKIDKLKLLQLKHVKLRGSYKNFPELRWLCWHGCPLKTMPCAILMTSLVAIDLTNGHLREFESPMVLKNLKILILKGCKTLVSIRNLHRLPNLESLILWNCWNLTHVCKSICGLGSLRLLDLTHCNKLWKASSRKMYVNPMECLKPLYIRGGITQGTLSLPDSLKFLFLSNCSLKNNSNVSLAFIGRPFLYINLTNNLFEFLPSYIDLQALRVLDLTSCVELKSLMCLPSTLEELYIYSCYSLEKITFQSARFRLREFGYEDCYALSEIQGLFSLVSVEEIDDADLGHMKWIKSCEYDSVKLVGDDIITGTSRHRMLYEFGITSTYLPGIIYQSMMPEYMSSSSFLSFIVPSCPKKRKIRGLNVNSVYKPTGEDILALLAKVSNKTKGLTWIYNPVVYSEPAVDEDAVWLSYWPIGNILDSGDEVNVDIIVGNGFIVSGCSATLVYMDGELCQENCKYMIKEEEVIGGDLSEFELTKGAFYLCRRDFFKSMTPDWIKTLVGDTIHYKELKGWKKSRQSRSKASYSELKTFRGFHGKKIVVKVDLCCAGIKQKVMNAASSIKGIESLTLNMKHGTLTVTGDVDPVTVVGYLRMVHTEIVSVRPAKEPEKKT